MALKMPYSDSDPQGTGAEYPDAYWTITTAQQNIYDLNGVVVLTVYKDEARYRARLGHCAVKSFVVPQESFIPILTVLKQGGEQTAYQAIYEFLKGYKEGAPPVAGPDGVTPDDTRPLFFAGATDA